MTLPSPLVLGAVFGLSEMLLSILKRSGKESQTADRGSLRLIWIVIVISIALAVAAIGLVPAARLPFAEQLYAVGAALFALGLLLRWYSIFWLGRFFTVDVAVAGDHRVIDTGPYRYLRHPSYAGVLLAFLGLGLCYGNAVSLALLVLPVAWVFHRRIVIEEEALLAALGESYRSYMARTRRLVPWIY